jgi:hypothetical protein
MEAIARALEALEGARGAEGLLAALLAPLEKMVALQVGWRQGWGCR